MSPKAAVSPTRFSWEDLGQYKAHGHFLEGYPAHIRTFFAPDDRIHELLQALLAGARHSIVLNMFGYADDELDATIRSKLADDRVFIQMSLDSTQAGGKHEREILAKWDNDAFGNSIAIGTSSKHAISHLKIVIVDGIYTVRGSTNWSLSGEQKQDNELTLTNSAVIAAETRSVLDRNHDFMLKQMAAKAAKKKLPRRLLAAASAGAGAPTGTGRVATRRATVDKELARLASPQGVAPD